jgi:5-methylcytosine-specific restriction protein A
MKFGYNQFLKFETYEGAYSFVTERERFDSQITATDVENDILVNYFGKSSIHVGKVSLDRMKAQKEFLLYPSGESIKLNLTYPKPNKTELRLYLSNRAGFKPEANTIWFLFVKNEKIWIGNLSEKEWRKESSSLIIDDSDQYYQDLIVESDKIRRTKLTERDAFKRDRKIALKRMRMENFKCEFDPKHNLFIARSSHKPYLESHHLVPISLQDELKTNLDRLDNLFCLCPNCHRAIHYSEKNYSKKIIERLIIKRPTILDILSIGKDDLYKYYSVEDILRN